MIEKLEVRTIQGDLLSLPLGDYSNGYLLNDIQGTDPVKTSLVSSSFANQDGEVYQSGRREPRSLILFMDLEPAWNTNQTIRDLRKFLYRVFETKSELSLKFFLSDGPDVEIKARKESIEAPAFTDTPNAKITLECFDPDFIDPTPVVLEGETVADSTETTIVYDGDIETGIKLVVNVDRSVDDLTVYHTGPDGVLRSLEFAAPLLSGDVLTISTVRGSKGATLVRTGVTSSVLFAVSAQSNWTELDTGANLFRVYTDGDPIPYTLEYTTRYGGL
jgi:hypothetical protein